jgi:hypothetical protein
MYSTASANSAFSADSSRSNNADQQLSLMSDTSKLHAIAGSKAPAKASAVCDMHLISLKSQSANLCNQA